MRENRFTKFGRKRPMKRRRRNPKRFAMEKVFDRGGIGAGVMPKPLTRPERFIGDVGDDLGHPKFLSKGDIEGNLAGMGNKMRPRPYRPKMRPKRRRMFFGRPMEKRGVMRRRRRYSNFVGGGKGMTNTLLIVGGAVALLCFTPLGKMVGLKK
tara:strand:+ start:1652 stop:2110 length:459 start_codon:yes stop_codon:yes gene_type:complete